MMRVVGLSWNRYRVFKEPRSVKLAPITIIIGRNGSGKSVISRLPLLLAKAISKNPEGPLDLAAGGVDHAASYQDLVNMRGALPFSVGAEIENGVDNYIFETTLRHVNETRSLAIERFVLSHNGRTIASVELANSEQLTSHTPLYNFEVQGAAPKQLPLVFAGLFPIKLEGAIGQSIEAIHALFQSAFPIPSYLGPFRVEPARSTRMPMQGIRELGPRGERALELLADDVLRHGGKLTEAVGEWFTQAMGQGVMVDVSKDQPQIYIKDLTSELEVSLSDTGAGFSQALPVVVQHFAHRLGRLQSSVLIVEQPELHLHPAAHGSLADLIVKTAVQGDVLSGMTCMTETHSEQFLMRVRRRIAEGLKPEHVALWSLNHRDALDQEPQPLRVIEFDKAGNPSAWPVGVFEESLQDLTIMRKASRDRGV